MLSPAAVSAAAAALRLLLVLLGPGPSLSEPDFGPCSRCFYRQTPPRGGSAGPPPLHPLCHRLPGGWTFASLTRPTCDTAVYSAFHLSHGWTEEEGKEEEEGGEQHVEEEEVVSIPALLRRGGGPSQPGSPEDPPPQDWDSAVTALVRSSITPQCHSLGGDLYVLTGAGGFRGGDEACPTRPLWSAVCCTVPEGQGGFSVALIREAEEGERQVSVTELEEILGVEELFSGGCGGAEEGAAAMLLNLFSKGLFGSGEKSKAGDAGVETDHTDADSNEAAQGSRQGSVSEEEAIEAGVQTEKSHDAYGQAEQPDDSEDTPETPADSTTSEGSSDKQPGQKYSAAVGSESSESSESSDDDDETVDDQQTDTNSSSTVVYVLSTTVSILKAPLRPIFSRITQFPGQVVYVLQEDLGVLSSLPGDSFDLLYLLTSDLLGWMRYAAEVVLGVGGSCLSCTYHCSSSMLGALLGSCYTGVTGVGTLAGDTVGIFGGALDNAWWVTKQFGGRLWDQSEGYVGSVVWEMGGQAQAVGGGLGRLAWSGGSTVGKFVRLVWDVIYDVVDIVFGGVSMIFGRESE